jgi:uncharacterized protein (TIGR03435 family)
MRGRSAATTTILAVVVPLIVLSAQQTKGPVFEVATIRPNTSGVGSGGLSASGIVTFNNTTVRDLIRRAYDVPPERVVGGPDWLDRDLFDFTGKGEAEALPARRMLMLRAFLADRLKLVVRIESREMPVFALVVARSDRRLGPQIRPSSADCAALRTSRGGATPPPTPAGQRPVCGAVSRLGFIIGGGVSMTEVAANIGRSAGRPVIDRTGLQGGYDFDLKWVPDEILKAASRPIDGPTFAVALEEQLGLRLEATRAPLEVVVVGSVERPSEN